MDSQKFGGMRNHKICSIKTSMFAVMKGGDLDWKIKEYLKILLLYIVLIIYI